MDGLLNELPGHSPRYQKSCGAPGSAKRGKNLHKDAQSCRTEKQNDQKTQKTTTKRLKQQQRDTNFLQKDTY